MRWFGLCAVLALQNTASAQIFKCTGDDGQIAYRDRPCAEGVVSDVVESISSGIGGQTDNYSMWVEPNFVDTAYSALLRSIEIIEVGRDSTIRDHVSYDWKPYRVKAEILEVYRGDLEPGTVQNLLIYVSALSRSTYDRIQGEYLLSFCRSGSGVFYTSRDYLVAEASSANVTRFQHVRDHGTDYEGPGDCSSTNDPHLNPDNHK